MQLGIIIHNRESVISDDCLIDIQVNHYCRNTIPGVLTVAAVIGPGGEVAVDAVTAVVDD